MAYSKIPQAVLPRRCSVWPLPWSAHPSSASSSRLCSVGTRHALECLLRRPRHILMYGSLPLRKNEHTGAAPRVGTRRRIAHRQERQWHFAQGGFRIFQPTYSHHRFASSPPDYLASLVSASGPHRSSIHMRQRSREHHVALSAGAFRPIRWVRSRSCDVSPVWGV